MARKYLLAAMAAGFLLACHTPIAAQTAPAAPAAETPPAPSPPAAPPPAAPPPAAPPPAVVQPLPKSEASGIVGRNVVGADGRDIGRIVDVIVDQSAQPRAVVVDFGGFLGVGSRRIAVDWAMLHFSPGDPAVPITLGLTPDQIKAAPEYREDAGKTPSVMVQPVAATPDAAPPAAKP